MKKIVASAALGLALLLSHPAAAQVQSAIVVSACGTPPVTYTAGQPNPVTMDTNGNFCGSNSGAPSGTVTPAAQTAVSSAALAANLVVKNSAGSLFSFNVSADSTLSGAAWWLMIYNATSAPSDGAVTPVKCYAMPSGATGISGAFPSPITFSTGITMGVSTTGCFTKTASTHAFLSGDFK